jgi:hypothetical protein
MKNCNTISSKSVFYVLVMLGPASGDLIPTYILLVPSISPSVRPLARYVFDISLRKPQVAESSRKVSISPPSWAERRPIWGFWAYARASLRPRMWSVQAERAARRT